MQLTRESEYALIGLSALASEPVGSVVSLAAIAEAKDLPRTFLAKIFQKLARHGIRVNSIAPGAFLTDMMNHIRDDPEQLAEFNASIPLGRSAGEDDMKGAAVFLASDASAYVTGTTLVVDGGTLAL